MSLSCLITPDRASRRRAMSSQPAFPRLWKARRRICSGSGRWRRWRECRVVDRQHGPCGRGWRWWRGLGLAQQRSGWRSRRCGSEHIGQRRCQQQRTFWWGLFARRGRDVERRRRRLFDRVGNLRAVSGVSEPRRQRLVWWCRGSRWRWRKWLLRRWRWRRTEWWWRWLDLRDLGIGRVKCSDVDAQSDGVKQR